MVNSLGVKKALSIVVTLSVLFALLYLLFYKPSEYFTQNLDLLRDKQISRTEWQALYPDSNLSSASGWARTFALGDCNNNGRLTWREYYGAQYRAGDHCRKEPNMQILYRKVPTNFNSVIGSYPFLFTEDQFNLIRPNSFGERETVQKLVSLAPKSISELKMTDNEKRKVFLNCDEKNSEMYLKKWKSVSQGTYKIRECNVKNESTTDTITALLLLLTESEMTETRQSIHIKSVFIPPASTQKVTIVYRYEVTPKEVSLLEGYVL